MKIRLSVSYPFEGDLALDANLTELVGRESDDSGAGFGRRDNGWFIDVADPDALVELIKSADERFDAQWRNLEPEEEEYVS